MNPVGLISMQYARPFTAEHFPLFAEMRRLGYDFVELLVPEPGELDLAETRRALEAAASCSPPASTFSVTFPRTIPWPTGPASTI